MPGRRRFPVKGSVQCLDGSIRTPYEIKDLASKDKSVESLHQLRDASGEVPPVDVEQVNVRGLEPLEGCLDVDVKRFEAVPGELNLLGDIRVPEVGGARVLQRN